MRGQVAITDDVYSQVLDAYDYEVKQLAGRWIPPFAYRFYDGIHYWLFTDGENRMHYLRALKTEGWDVYQLRNYGR